MRESFRTPNGPRGRTICNLTHLPKEVRDMVAHALKGEALVPVGKIEVNNIHSCGGCVVLEDAAKRHEVEAWLAPLGNRNGALVRAMIFGGLLMAPSVAPFYVEARTWRLAAFCGLDGEDEPFDAADLGAALGELDARYGEVRAILLATPPVDLKGVAVVREGMKSGELGVLGLDGQGVPIPLEHGDTVKGQSGLGALMQELAGKSGGPILALEEKVASHINVEKYEGVQYVAGLGREAVEGLVRLLNAAQLHDALRTGGPVEVRHQGRRHVLMPAGASLRAGDDSGIRMGSLKELSAIPGVKGEERGSAAGGLGIAPGAGHFLGAVTNVPLEKLPGRMVIEWAGRAERVHAAFTPVQIVIGGLPGPEDGNGVVMWRNHRNLQFITHRLRCLLHAEWSARGEPRPVEDVLRDLQEVHRATLTVNGEVVRRTASAPSAAVHAMMERIGVMGLFASRERKGRGRGVA